MVHPTKYAPVSLTAVTTSAYTIALTPALLLAIGMLVDIKGIRREDTDMVRKGERREDFITDWVRVG